MVAKFQCVFIGEELVSSVAVVLLYVEFHSLLEAFPVSREGDKIPRGTFFWTPVFVIQSVEQKAFADRDK
jgi:hypothetical protein